jgi:orotidine-5'-phosphate decarboxylase
MSPSAALVRASTQGRVSRSRSRPPRCRGSRPAPVSRRPSTASARATTAPNGGTQERRVPAGSHFGDRLGALVAARESQVVLGLDPDPARLWPEATASAPPTGTPAKRAAAAVQRHCQAAIDAAGPACVAVKPQLACFERLGAPGWAALAATIEHARAAGLLVLADGKRGDIDVSASAYAQALAGETPTPFGTVHGLGADAYTVSPYMGLDTLKAIRTPGAGIFVLVRTSNPGAADVEDIPTDTGERVWERVARLVDGLGDPGPDTGLHDVGAVVGATAPEHIARMRELMPRTTFLLPGIGAQGGRVEDLGPAFVPGRAGGLISASRSIVAAYEHQGGEPAAAARREAERLRALAWSLIAP